MNIAIQMFAYKFIDKVFAMNKIVWLVHVVP